MSVLTPDTMDPALRTFLGQLAETVLPIEGEYLSWIRINRVSLLDDWLRAGLPQAQMCAWLRREFDRCQANDISQFSAVPGANPFASLSEERRGPSGDLTGYFYESARRRLL